jgi:hypothetical protein
VWIVSSISPWECEAGGDRSRGRRKGKSVGPEGPTLRRKKRQLVCGPSSGSGSRGPDPPNSGSANLLFPPLSLTPRASARGHKARAGQPRTGRFGRVADGWRRRFVEALYADLGGNAGPMVPAGWARRGVRINGHGVQIIARLQGMRRRTEQPPQSAHPAHGSFPLHGEGLKQTVLSVQTELGRRRRKPA